MLGEKLYEYRKKNAMSQEVLAEKLDVARQTVSNWETGETSPNPEQLKILSHIFNISLDQLLENEDFIGKESGDHNNQKEKTFSEGIKVYGVSGICNQGFEYKSKTLVHGLPLIHINLGGLIPRRAKGIIAIGNIAQGVVALGGVSLGLVSFGGLSAGLVSMGGIALGLLVALGGAAIAPIALGGAAIGIIACGGGALGYITNKQ